VSGETEYRLLEDPDGASGYAQVATIAADATSHDLAVFLPTRVNASYVLRACNSAGCGESAPVTVSGSLAAVGYVKSSNTGASDQFGQAVALSSDGTTLAVGAPYEDSSATGIDGNQADDAAGSSGAVYVFRRTGAGWAQQAYLKASNTGAGDDFGYALALSGDGATLAVGAWAEDSSATGINGDQADDSAAESGAVYVFTRSGTSWSQQAYVKGSNTGAGDSFGFAVALSGSGDTLAVGAYTEDSSATGIDGNQSDNAASSSGAAYLFGRSGTTWSQQAYVKASDTGAGDLFAGAVALSADGARLAAGAINEDAAASNAGAVYLFAWSGTAWGFEAKVTASDAAGGDCFGTSVALSGAGDTLAVGASLQDGGFANSGAAYYFTRSGATWTEQGRIKPLNAEANDDFGYAVSLSLDGKTLAVGADVEGTGSGAAYLFNLDGATWTQLAFLKAPNSATNDAFGYALSLSGDGATLAVGAIGEGSSATGIGGDPSDNSASYSGAVYLY
jgi:hypothetical protein